LESNTVSLSARYLIYNIPSFITGTFHHILLKQFPNLNYPNGRGQINGHSVNGISIILKRTVLE